jgi:hypothetical protein
MIAVYDTAVMPVKDMLLVAYDLSSKPFNLRKDISVVI